MDGAIAVAVLAAALALISNSAVYFSTRTRSRLADRLTDAEARLTACEQERARLRRNEQVVMGALLGLLPGEKRIRLLQQIDRFTEPETDT